MRKSTLFPSLGLLPISVLLLLLATLITADASKRRRIKNQQLPIISSPLSTFQSPSNPPIRAKSHNFTLRHIFHHGTYQHPEVHKRLDVRSEDVLWTVDDERSELAGPLSFQAASRAEPIQRLTDRRMQSVEDLINSAQRKGTPSILVASDWVFDEVSGPNITDKDTVISLANMAANAYVKVPGTEDWEDVNTGKNREFNHSAAFGWEGDGLRGHIFADPDNSTIVIGLKGTTPAVFDGSGSTTRDKMNDNLFFSCCCGQGGHYLWRPVCDCNTAAFTCNNTCLIKNLRERNMYYTAAMELYGNVTEMYPDSQIWLAGHSLGGSVSSLLGLTFGLPVTTFEAPAEALAAARLGLPVPPLVHDGLHQLRQFTGAYHFGHTADPIYMGTCNAATSACTLGGYAMETQCHTGKVCVYDTVDDKQWRVSASTHSIRSVIKNVIKAYDELPTCEPDSTEDDPCVDCFNWKYFESNGSEITSTSSSISSTSSATSISMTRTETCKTPGWWGCLVCIFIQTFPLKYLLISTG